jgi:hypothetical protein
MSCNRCAWQSAATLEADFGELSRAVGIPAVQAMAAWADYAVGMVWEFLPRCPTCKKWVSPLTGVCRYARCGAKGTQVARAIEWPPAVLGHLVKLVRTKFERDAIRAATGQPATGAMAQGDEPAGDQPRVVRLAPPVDAAANAATTEVAPPRPAPVAPASPAASAAVAPSAVAQPASRSAPTAQSAALASVSAPARNSQWQAWLTIGLASILAWFASLFKRSSRNR